MHPTRYCHAMLSRGHRECEEDPRADADASVKLAAELLGHAGTRITVIHYIQRSSHRRAPRPRIREG